MRRTAFLLLLVLILVLAIAFGVAFREKHCSETFPIMGTTVTITVNSGNARSHVKAAQGRLKGIEKLLDRFDPQSEISRINREGYANKIYVSKDTYKCIEQAQKVSRLTKGAFDITLTGNYKNIHLVPKERSIKLKKKGVKLNLGGIGKGYAVEEARKLLFRRGVKSAMIDMHSSIAVLGGPWKVGIKNPLKKDAVLGVFVLSSSEALSTSGIYEQGKHIIDPRKGLAADSCLSVTVKGRDAGMLDGLSTGIFVLGPKDGTKLAKKMKLHMIMLTKSGKIITL